MKKRPTPKSTTATVLVQARNGSWSPTTIPNEEVTTARYLGDMRWIEPYGTVGLFKSELTGRIFAAPMGDTDEQEAE